MKKVILLVIVVSLISCNKELDNDKYEKILTKKGWYIDKQTRSAVDNPSEFYDDYATWTSCVKKNIRYYRKGGEYEWVTTCPGYNNIKGSWQFNSDKTTFFVNIEGNSYEYIIESFKKTRLIVHMIDSFNYSKPYYIERELISYEPE